MDAMEVDALLAMVRAGDGSHDTQVRAAVERVERERSAEALNQLGTALIKAGRADLAGAAYQASASLDPTLYKPLLNLGNLVLATDPRRASAWFRRAAEAAEQHPKVWLSLGNALSRMGDDAEAVRAFERSATLEPTWNALHNLGATYLRAGQPDDAIAAFERALAIDPSAVGTLISLGEAFVAAGRRDDADGTFRRAGDMLPPTNADAATSLLSLVSEHYFDATGIEIAERALDHLPEHTALWFFYLLLLERNGEMDRAEARLVEACRSASDASAFLHLARLRALQRRYDDEAKLLADASAKFPDHPAVLAQVARRLRADGKLDEAVELLERLVVRSDCSLDMLEVLGATFLDIGDARSAFDAFRRAEAMATGPGQLNRVMMAYISNLTDGLSSQEVFAAHRHIVWNPSAVPRVELVPRSHSRSRPLRIGYLSPDFRSHSVALFIEGVLREHDRTSFAVTCYSVTRHLLDATTERIRQLPLGFRDARSLSDFELAQQIARDEIDIVVDLAGLMSENRMLTLCMRPAPIVATYLGYPHTTGLTGVDYRITDGWTDPEGADEFYTEQLYRLPRCAWAFQLFEQAPPVATRSAAQPVVFGSFNNLQKTTAATLDLWAQVLRAVPGSRLLIKAKQLGHRRARQRVLSELEGRGVDVARLELRERTTNRYDHLAMYGDVDIALDAYPYNGTTTTCEALHMGVPVVSLRGETPASRVGASLLRAVHLSDLATDTVDAYVAAAVGLARDPARRRELRDQLRSTLGRSELGDSRGMARALEAAYRQMWTEWVTRQGPMAADVPG